MSNKKLFSSARVAIVADWLTVSGGAEKVLEIFAHTFPNAEFFTSVYIPENFPFLKNKVVHTSWLQSLPKAFRKRHQVLFPFLPSAIESLDMRGFDIVISSSTFVAKSVITSPSTLHMCYCHTPTRYFWDEWQLFLKEGLNIPSFLRPLKRFFPALFTRFRPWDFYSAQRPDVYFANSEYVQQRIEKYYRRESIVLRPPVDFERFSVAKNTKTESFVALGRLIPYKRFDLLVKTFKTMPQKKLIIAGTGPETEYLKSISEGAKNITFAGFVPDDELPNMLANARAFLFPQLEDAGIAPMEALCAGTPVIAFARGGSEGLIEDGVNGIFFKEQTVDCLRDAIQRFENNEDVFIKNRKKIQNAMKKYSEKAFSETLLKTVQKYWDNFSQQ